MKIALVCIAKNEDPYIQEWVDYHLKLGFDKIYIYENDWSCNITHGKVIRVQFPGQKMQLPAYNSFISQYKNYYDWVAFLDVDEFLVLKKHKTIHEFILNYIDEDCIGINWVLFGDNNLKSVETYSVIARFTKRESVPNIHIKSIVNLKKVRYMHVHNPSGKIVDTNLKRIDNSPFNQNGPIDVAQINHYFCKTKDEFIKKVNRGRSDTGTFRDMSDFDSHNKNEIDDFWAYNFFLDKV